MNKAIFYTKQHEISVEFWAKLVSEKNDIIIDVNLNYNNDYNSIINWKHYDLKININCSEFTNELFHYYYMPIIFKFLNFQETHKVKDVYFEGEHPHFFIIAGFFREKNIKISGLKLYKKKYFILFFRNFYLYIKTQLISLIFITFKTIQNINLISSSMNIKNEFALIHSQSSYRNIKKLKLDLIYFYDDINLTLQPNKNKFVSFYKMIKITDYLKLIINSFILTHHIFVKLKTTSNTILGPFGTIHALKFFSTRIGHYLLIKQAYKNIFNHNSGVKFYSGERESRYGILAMEFSKIHQNYSIAIPHGMSYSYKYPLGLYGHKYYCTTLNESKFLNEIYNETKFIFDKDLMNTIYQTNKYVNTNKKIIFFTEPRRAYVNTIIIKNLKKILDDNFYIKLHPLEDITYYEGFKNIKYINDFEEAIQSNICISRKSTILVEALYNQSVAIALLVDKQDQHDFNNTFPSLLDPEINQCCSYKELEDIIKK